MYGIQRLEGLAPMGATPRKQWEMANLAPALS